MNHYAQESFQVKYAPIGTGVKELSEGQTYLVNKTILTDSTWTVELQGFLGLQFPTRQFVDISTQSTEQDALHNDYTEPDVDVKTLATDMISDLIAFTDGDIEELSAVLETYLIGSKLVINELIKLDYTIHLKGHQGTILFDEQDDFNISIESIHPND